jgi:hypothetical protein
MSGKCIPAHNIRVVQPGTNGKGFWSTIDLWASLFVTQNYSRIDTKRTLLGYNFVCDATYVLLGEQICAEACPPSGTSHVINPFSTRAPSYSCELPPTHRTPSAST